MNKKKVFYVILLVSFIISAVSLLFYLTCFLFINTQKALTLCPMASIEEIQEKKAFRVFFLAPLDKVPFPYGYECRTVFNEWHYDRYFVEEEEKEEEFLPLKGKMSF